MRNIETDLSRAHSPMIIGGITWEPPFGRPWIVGGLGGGRVQEPEVTVAQGSRHTRRLVALIVGGIASAVTFRYFLWDSPPQPTITGDLLKMAGDLAKSTGIGTGVAALTYTLVSRFRNR